MQYVNKVILLGNLGRDPEFKSLQNSDICTFSLATERSWKNSSGEWESSTEWHRCVVWGKGAAYIRDNARKADKLYVEGEIRSREYEKDGQKQKIYEINVLSFIILNKKEKTETVREDDGSWF